MPDGLLRPGREMTGVPRSVRFVPSRVVGLPGVAEVIVFPVRMELLSKGRPVTVRFADIAKWPRPRWLSRLGKRLGRRSWLPVADRDFFHSPPDRFFRFYTDPPLVVYMPVADSYARKGSCFAAVQEVLAAGGFSTFDLG
jgi:hypothetical protein